MILYNNTSCPRPRVAVAHSGEMEEKEERGSARLHMFNFTMLVGIQYFLVVSISPLTDLSAPGHAYL
jgi:hypothetical protein